MTHDPMHDQHFRAVLDHRRQHLENDYEQHRAKQQQAHHAKIKDILDQGARAAIAHHDQYGADSLRQVIMSMLHDSGSVNYVRGIATALHHHGRSDVSRHYSEAADGF